ncbi:Uncharacterized protein GBIM_07058, partial [Gryllus bimaculatus]
MAVTKMRLRRLLLFLLAAVAVAGAASAATAAEDDFAFENAPEEEVAPAAAAAAAATGAGAGNGTAGGGARPAAGAPFNAVGVPASVDAWVFCCVPDDAFSGDVRSYELVGVAPAWLRLERTSGLLEGVPGPGDAGDVYLTLRARGAAGDSAKDVFAVEVRPRPASARDLRAQAQCVPGEDAVMVTVVLDASFDAMSAQQRAAAIKNAAGFLALAPSALWLGPLPRGAGAGGAGGAGRETTC